MNAPRRHLVLAVMTVVACGVMWSSLVFAGDEATLTLQPALRPGTSCADCETVKLKERLGLLEISVIKNLRLSIPISQSNVLAIKVGRGTDVLEWKAWVWLDDETLSRARDFDALAPESEYSLVSRGNRVLSVTGKVIVDRSVLFGHFTSKGELEEALGIGTLPEYPRPVERYESKESLDAIKAADQLIERNAAEAKVWEKIKRALREGDTEKADRLLEGLKKQEEVEE